jgi:FkbM family methyltransferase
MPTSTVCGEHSKVCRYVEKRMDPSLMEKAIVLYARHFPIRRGKLRLINSLSASASNKSTLRMTTLKYGGFKMSCDLAEMIQRQFYFFGTYFIEEVNIECWQSIARNARTILDVGANAGIYSLAALAAQPQATVHAFEPTPEIARRLRDTAQLNNLTRLHVHQVAVSSENGTASLKRYRGDLGINEGMNFISQTQTDKSDERVQTVNLDQFCRDRSIDRIDLLKIDVQGHEYAVLKGAEQLIRTGCIGTIFMELNWARSPLSTCSATQSVQLLQEFHYRFSKPGRHPAWQPAGNWLRMLGDVVARRSFQKL